MLTSTEMLCLKVFRKTVILTAAVALLVAALGSVFWFYSVIAPAPSIHMADRLDSLRSATRVANLVKKVFPEKSEAVQTADEAFPAPTSYSLHTDAMEAFDDANAVLSDLWQQQFASKDIFAKMLFGDDAVPFSWNKDISNSNATNENNVNVLWQSLLVEYLQQLRVAASGKLKEYKNSGRYDSAFTKLHDDVYFIRWFFETLQKEVTAARDDLERKRVERAALSASGFVALTVAGIAFGYFLVIMFFFLAIAIEVHVRALAESSQKGLDGKKEASAV